MHEHETQQQKVKRLIRELAEARRILVLMQQDKPQKPAEPKNVTLREGQQPSQADYPTLSRVNESFEQAALRWKSDA